ncbi:Hypothetical_protein [Hexamita inflata]|uniref:Hypothetical_protein n=1 Tax=Hexamita inflata TaxID=28002 RepID=A0AA86PLX8_9EUKA|nr:Hypothetical protein HINF_LOCUS29511 [Hexamita inflata]
MYIQDIFGTKAGNFSTHSSTSITLRYLFLCVYQLIQQEYASQTRVAYVFLPLQQENILSKAFCAISSRLDRTVLPFNICMVINRTNDQIYNRFDRRSSYILNFNRLLVGFTSQLDDQVCLQLFDYLPNKLSLYQSKENQSVGKA